MRDSNCLDSSVLVNYPKGFSFNRPILSYSRVQRALSKLLRNRRFQLALLDFDKTPYLNLGCGRFPHPKFVNLDFDWFSGVNLCWDISGGLPFPNARLSGVFSEHCLEHVSLELAERTFREIKRVLKPGGVFRLVLPDAEKYLDLYQKAKQGECVQFPYGQYLDPQVEKPTPMMMVNHVFRSYGHQYAYDEETLTHLLKRAGFTEVSRCQYRQGSNSELLLDQSWREVESIYLECSVRE